MDQFSYHLVTPCGNVAFVVYAENYGQASSYAYDHANIYGYYVLKVTQLTFTMDQNV